MAKVIFSKDPEKYIPALALALKGIEEFSAPEWSMFVKSGTSRQRPPMDNDFWYTRAASILRQLYIRGVLGVGRLRVKYGSRKDRGGRRGEFRKSSGKMIRVILQRAEAVGLVEKVDKMRHGRRLTQKGRDFLDSIDVEETKGLSIDSEIIRSRVVGESEPEDQIDEFETKKLNNEIGEDENGE